MKETKRVLFFTTSEMAPDDSFFQAITTLFGFFTRDGIEFENDFLWPLPTDEAAIQHFRGKKFDLIFLCLRPITPGFSRRVYDLLTEEQRQVLICIGHSVTDDTRKLFDGRLFEHTVFGEVNIDTYVSAIATKLGT